MKLIITLSTLFLIGATTNAFAQEQHQYHLPIIWDVNAGAMTPVGQTSQTNDSSGLIGGGAHIPIRNWLQWDGAFDFGFGNSSSGQTLTFSDGTIKKTHDYQMILTTGPRFNVPLRHSGTVIGLGRRLRHFREVHCQRNQSEHLRFIKAELAAGRDYFRLSHLNLRFDAGRSGCPLARAIVVHGCPGVPRTADIPAPEGLNTLLRGKFDYETGTPVPGVVDLSVQTRPRRVLVWHDEFNGPRNSPLHRSKWAYDLGDGGWGNHELETYTNRIDNVFQDGREHLVIRALHASHGLYASGRINTFGRFEFTYGAVEARIRVTAGEGLCRHFGC